MTGLISAKDAKEAAELAKYNKEADELLKPIAKSIKYEAERGATHVIVDGKEWYRATITFNPAHKLAISKLGDAGYRITDNAYQYAPNGGKPSEYYGIKIDWS